MCINVYGHRKVEDGFFHCYSDFVRNEGAPSALRRNNHAEGKNDKVLALNRQLLVKEQFSEVDNQQQNKVETGAIRWLKVATHILLDMTNAPDFAWFLALQYLATLHK